MMSCVKIFSITKVAPINKSVPGEDGQNENGKKLNVPHFMDLGKVFFLHYVVVKTKSICFQSLASLNLDISLFHELLRLLKTRPGTENISYVSFINFGTASNLFNNSGTE